jgi:hypothetical protein
MNMEFSVPKVKKPFENKKTTTSSGKIVHRVFSHNLGSASQEIDLDNAAEKSDLSSHNTNKQKLS